MDQYLIKDRKPIQNHNYEESLVLQERDLMNTLKHLFEDLIL